MPTRHLLNRAGLPHTMCRGQLSGHTHLATSQRSLSDAQHGGPFTSQPCPVSRKPTCYHLKTGSPSHRHELPVRHQTRRFGDTPCEDGPARRRTTSELNRECNQLWEDTQSSTVLQIHIAYVIEDVCMLLTCDVF